MTVSELDQILRDVSLGAPRSVAKDQIKHLMTHIVTSTVSNVYEAKRLRQKITQL